MRSLSKLALLIVFGLAITHTQPALANGGLCSALFSNVKIVFGKLGLTRNVEHQGVENVTSPSGMETLSKRKVALSLSGPQLTLNIQNKWNLALALSGSVLKIEPLEFGKKGMLAGKKRLLISITTTDSVKTYEIDFKGRAAIERQSYRLAEGDSVLAAQTLTRRLYTEGRMGRIKTELEPYQFVLSERSLTVFEWKGDQLVAKTARSFDEPVVDFNVTTSQYITDGGILIRTRPLILVAHRGKVDAFDIGDFGIRKSDSLGELISVGKIQQIVVSDYKIVTNGGILIETRRGLLIVSGDMVRLYKVESGEFTKLDEKSVPNGIASAEKRIEEIPDPDGILIRRTPVLVIQSNSGVETKIDISSSSLKEI